MSNEQGQGHTPTPWTRDCYGIYAAQGVLGKKIAHSECVDNSEAEANAEFIVRAVNAHEELVAALESILLEIRTPQRWSTLEVAVRDLATAAIKSATVRHG